MVIFLQLLIFLIAAISRGRTLFGKHLKQISENSNRLSYSVTQKNGGVTRLHYGLEQAYNVPFIIMREKWYHRILKFIGMADEIQVSNALFNKKYYIITDYPSHLERLLKSESLLKNLQELMAMNVHALHATHHRIWCVIKGKNLAESRAYSSRPQYYDLLQKISEDTSITALKWHGRLPEKRIGLIAFVFISLHAGILSLALLGILPIHTDSVNIGNVELWILKGLTFGAFAAAAWFFLIVAFFKRSSWACWVLADFIVCGIVGFLLSGIFIVREANIHMVQNPAGVYTQPIIQRTCILECKKRCGRRCTRRASFAFYTAAECTPESRAAIMAEKKRVNRICANRAWYEYNLTIPHWEPSEANYTFPVSSTYFDGVATGSMLDVPVNPGALGLEWVDYSEITPKK